MHVEMARWDKIQLKRLSNISTLWSLFALWQTVCLIWCRAFHPQAFTPLLPFEIFLFFLFHWSAEQCKAASRKQMYALRTGQQWSSASPLLTSLCRTSDTMDCAAPVNELFFFFHQAAATSLQPGEKRKKQAFMYTSSRCKNHIVIFTTNCGPGSVVYSCVLVCQRSTAEPQERLTNWWET